MENVPGQKEGLQCSGTRRGLPQAIPTAIVGPYLHDWHQLRAMFYETQIVDPVENSINTFAGIRSQVVNIF
jgi:hypothetical protein